MQVIFKNQFSDQVNYMHAEFKKKSMFNLLAAPDQALQATCLSQGHQDIAWPSPKKEVF